MPVVKNIPEASTSQALVPVDSQDDTSSPLLRQKDKEFKENPWKVIRETPFMQALPLRTNCFRSEQTSRAWLESHTLPLEEQDSVSAKMTTALLGMASTLDENLYTHIINLGSAKPMPGNRNVFLRQALRLMGIEGDQSDLPRHITSWKTMSSQQRPVIALAIFKLILFDALIPVVTNAEPAKPSAAIWVKPEAENPFIRKIADWEEVVSEAADVAFPEPGIEKTAPPLNEEQRLHRLFSEVVRQEGGAKYEYKKSQFLLLAAMIAVMTHANFALSFQGKTVQGIIGSAYSPLFREKLTNCAQNALGISPLMILLARNSIGVRAAVAGETMGSMASALLPVSLGSEGKPQALIHLEAAVWKQAFKASMGADVDLCLQEVLILCQRFKQDRSPGATKQPWFEHAYVPPRLAIELSPTYSDDPLSSNQQIIRRSSFSPGLPPRHQSRSPVAGVSTSKRTFDDQDEEGSSPLKKQRLDGDIAQPGNQSHTLSQSIHIYGPSFVVQAGAAFSIDPRQQDPVPTHDDLAEQRRKLEQEMKEREMKERGMKEREEAVAAAAAQLKLERIEINREKADAEKAKAEVEKAAEEAREREVQRLLKEKNDSKAKAREDKKRLKEADKKAKDQEANRLLKEKQDSEANAKNSKNEKLVKMLLQEKAVLQARLDAAKKLGQPAQEALKKGKGASGKAAPEKAKAADKDDPESEEDGKRPPGKPKPTRKAGNFLYEADEPSLKIEFEEDAVPTDRSAHVHQHSIQAFDHRDLQMKSVNIKAGKYSIALVTSMFDALQSCVRLTLCPEKNTLVPNWLHSDPRIRTQSAIVLVNDENEKAEAIMDILQHSSVFIPSSGRNHEQRYGFDVSMMERIYCVDHTLLAQDMTLRHSFPSEEEVPADLHQLRQERKADQNQSNFHVTTTLRKMVNYPGSRRTLNCLSIPMQECEWQYATIPRLQDLSSCARAFRLSNLGGTIPMPPRRDMHWAITSHEGCWHLMHIDTAGVVTIITIPTGGKLWSIITPKEGAPPGFLDLNSIDWLPESWSPEEFDPNLYHVDQVLLGPGDTLIMKPGALHVVVSSEDTVMAGSHFYTSKGAASSVTAFTHALLLDRLVSNVSHPDIIVYREYMMIRFLHTFETHIKGFPQTASGHDLRWDRSEDLIAIAQWGLLLIFADSLDIRHYFSKEDAKENARNPLFDDQALRLQTRDRYLETWRTEFPKHFHLTIGGKRINAFHSFICRPALHYAVALVAYYRKKFKTQRKTYQPIMHPRMTESVLIQHLSADLDRMDTAFTTGFRLMIDSEEYLLHTTLLANWTDLQVTRIDSGGAA